MEHDLADILLIVFIIVIVLGIIAMIGNEFAYGKKVGVVVDKHYYPPHNKTDEKFLLELEKEINGEKLRVSIYVPEYIYKEYKIGDYYGGENND